MKILDIKFNNFFFSLFDIRVEILFADVIDINIINVLKDFGTKKIFFK